MREARLISRHKFETDMKSNRLTAIRIREYEIAKKMLLDSEPISKIVKYTDLSEKDILNIEKNLKK